MATLNPVLDRPHADSRARLATYWLFTILGPFSFVIGGALFLTGQPQQIAQLAALGLPAILAPILGVAKLAGAIVSVVPRLALAKEWAYAGFAFLLAGASALHTLHGDGPAKALPPLMFLAFVGASYALRPASRRLALVAADRKAA